MDNRGNILIVEDNPGMRESCSKLLRLEGYETVEAANADEALDFIRSGRDVDIVLTDLKMPGMDGVALLKEIKSLDEHIEVILMTGYGTVKSAVEAMMQGAADYITKPFDTNELLSTIGKIVQLGGLKQEVTRLRSELRDKYRFDNIVGASSKMQPIFEKIEAARNTASTVLISGESGTGKELVAKAIHCNSSRADKPFVAVNCAAMPRDLIESELFGHRKGAFTGALEDRGGLFRAAEGGTLLLDEVVDMPIGTQAKLLRALQERRIRPIGGSEEVPVDVRVIASTNQDPAEAIRENRFREDLYYRLAVIRIELPPLRDRMEDVPALVQHFIDKLGKTSSRHVRSIAPDALETLQRYNWPGNIRELEGVIESAMAMGKDEVIQKAELPAQLAELGRVGGFPAGEKPGHVPTLQEVEKMLLLRALAAARGNKTLASTMLGVSRPRLYKMMRRHGVQEE